MSGVTTLSKRGLGFKTDQDLIVSENMFRNDTCLSTYEVLSSDLHSSFKLTMCKCHCVPWRVSWLPGQDGVAPNMRHSKLSGVYAGLTTCSCVVKEAINRENCINTR